MYMYVSVALHRPIGESRGKEISKVRCLSKVDNATQFEADTLVRSAQARLVQVGRATLSETETIARRSARTRQTSHVAHTKATQATISKRQWPAANCVPYEKD